MMLENNMVAKTAINSELVSRLMFDWENFSAEEMTGMAEKMNRKILRWLATNHPDNRTRKLFLRLTGIKIGEGTVVNPYCVFADGYLNNIEIGDRCAISPYVIFIAESNPNNSRLIDNEYVGKKLIKNERIVIGDDVWIGANVTILPGVRIGDKSIIGANSLVTREVPENVIVAGCPASIKRALD